LDLDGGVDLTVDGAPFFEGRANRRSLRMFFAMSASQTSAFPSEGARQSPRGLSEPPADTLGPFGMADRLNWLKAKKRLTKTTNHSRIGGRS
jgi:hypothetical protein